MPKSLTDMVKNLHELLQRKEDLKQEEKNNSAAIDAAKAEIVQQMIDDECTSIGCMGYTYSLQAKTKYNKKSDDDIAAAGVDFLDTLRAEGLGDIIKETVDARTLSATIRAYIEQNEELSEGLSKIVKPYDYNDIDRRKITKKMGAAK